MDDAIAAAVRQGPLGIRIPRSPTTPLLKVITWPYILKAGIVVNPWIQVLEVTALPILECTRHHIDTSLLRLNHGFGFGSVTGRSRAPGNVRELHVNAWIGRLEHRLELLDTRNILPRDRINTILIWFADEQDCYFSRDRGRSRGHHHFHLLGRHDNLCL